MGWSEASQGPVLPRWQRPLKTMSPFWVTVSLPTPFLPGLQDSGLRSARQRLWSRLPFLGPTSTRFSGRGPRKLEESFPPLTYCTVAAQVLIAREQPASLQFPSEKIKTRTRRKLKT